MAHESCDVTVTCPKCGEVSHERSLAANRVVVLERQRDEARKWLLSISVVDSAPVKQVQEAILEGARILVPTEEVDYF